MLLNEFCCNTTRYYYVLYYLLHNLSLSLPLFVEVFVFDTTSCRIVWFLGTVQHYEHANKVSKYRPYPGIISRRGAWHGACPSLVFANPAQRYEPLHEEKERLLLRRDQPKRMTDGNPAHRSHPAHSGFLLLFAKWRCDYEIIYIYIYIYINNITMLQC